MARPLIQMALDSLEFCSVGVGSSAINVRNLKIKQMPQIEPTVPKKMPWERLNKSAYKGGKTS